MKRWLISILIIYSFDTFSQEPAYINYTIRDGLPSNAVYCAIQDNRGFMWFGTEAGLSRFDGSTFKNYTRRDGLPDNEIINFFKDSKGRIWFFTINGKVGFVKDETLYNSDNLDYLKLLDGNLQITNIFEQDSTIVISGGDKIKTLNHQNQPGVLLESVISNYSYALPHKDSILVVDRLNMINSSTTHVGSIKELALPTNRNINYRPFHHHISGNKIYFTNLVNQIGVLDLESGSIQVSLPIQDVLNLTTINGKPVIFNSRGAFELNKDLQSPLGEQINEIDGSCNYFTDNTGNEWVTSVTTGIWFKKTDGLSKPRFQSTGKLFAGKRRLYIQSLNNVWALDPDGNLKIKYHEDNPFFVKNLWEDSDEVLLVFKNNGVIRNQSNVARMTFRKGYQLNGGLYAASHRAIHRFRDSKDFEKINDISFRNDSAIFLIRKWRISDFLPISEDSIYIASDNGLKLFAQDSFYHLGDSTDLENERLKEIAKGENNNLWLTTDGRGVLSYSEDSIRQFTKSEGLTGDICTSLLVDGDIVWLGTTSGLNKINDGAVQQVKMEDGLPSNYIVDIELFGDSIYVSTEEGLVAFLRDQDFIEDSKIPLHLESIYANQTRVQISDNLYFESSISNIELNFTAISFSKNESLKYRYQLVSDQEGIWRETLSNQVVYANLKPGDYTFILQAKTKNSEWSQPKKIRIIILIPIWRTWWFQSLGVILILVLFGIIFTKIKRAKHLRERLDRDKVEAEIRALKAQINPHFLFNALSSIQRFMMKDKKNLAEDYLADYGQLIRKVLDHSERLTVSLKEEMETLRLYTEIEQLRTNDQFETFFEVEEAVDPYITNIPSMIIQPLLENAIWHGIRPLKRKGKIYVSFGLDDDGKINVVVRDNGVGFEMGESVTKYKSFGSKLVRDRLELLRRFYKKDFQFEINSTPGKGTLINIKFPSNL